MFFPPKNIFAIARMCIKMWVLKCPKTHPKRVTFELISYIAMSFIDILIFCTVILLIYMFS